MNEASCNPRTFYHERVPNQFNRAFDSQQRAAANGDADAAQMLEGMRTVKATIGVVVTGGREEERFNLNVVAGRMSEGPDAACRPFMILTHDLDALAVLERESGDSVLGFLGAIAGIEQGMMLTSQRVQNLHALAGSLRFSLTGENAFTLVAHFGDGAIAERPSCAISVDGDAYAELRAGTLAPQDAFMNGKIEVQGDLQMAMQLALAALSPE